MTVFPHGFEERFGSIPVDEILGYQKCLRNLYEYIAEVTEMKPEKRMIDAVPLLDLIPATTAELKPLLDKAEKILNERLERRLF
jgi:DNA-directed RNA polymerase subunit F